VKQGLSTTAGFVIVPAIPALVFTIGSMPEIGYSVIYLIIWSLYLYVFTAVVEVVLGVPAYFIGKSFDLIRWWSASIIGFVIGTLAYLIIQSLLVVFSRATTPSPLGVAIGLSALGALGSFSGFIFWFLWSLGHPRGKR
jgi:hypothetical protein